MDLHTQCHRDIDGLLAEINRLWSIINRITDAVTEAQTYHVERTAQIDGNVSDVR